MKKSIRSQKSNSYQKLGGIQKIKMFRVMQNYDGSKVDDIPYVISEEFKRIGLSRMMISGKKIGIAVGSRGVRNLQLIIKSLIQEVKKRNGAPFIIPAMGSHGDANVEGQKKILEGFGIAEEKLGVPIAANMDIIELGRLDNGLTVYFDKRAYYSDGIIVVNRIKTHTIYKDSIESGLTKMLAVGLGNHEGARSVHCLGPEGIPELVKRFAKVILTKAPILCGLAILENAYEETKKIRACLPDTFAKIDQELLREYKDSMPSLPISNIDILILKEIGKDISGAGMDTNVVGGVKVFKEADYTPPRINKIVVLNLTQQSHGNAMGVGIADIITKRLYEKIDFEATYKNVITCGYFDRVKIPVVLDTDREAIKVALMSVENIPGKRPRIILIRNTSRLDEMLVSEAVWDEIKDREEIVSKGSWGKLIFEKNGNLNVKI
jgi:hypothetical protein